jgi:hypothetical protein
MNNDIAIFVPVLVLAPLGFLVGYLASHLVAKVLFNRPVWIYEALVYCISVSSIGFLVGAGVRGAELLFAIITPILLMVVFSLFATELENGRKN